MSLIQSRLDNLRAAGSEWEIKNPYTPYNCHEEDSESCLMEKLQKLWVDHYDVKKGDTVKILFDPSDKNGHTNIYNIYWHDHFSDYIDTPFIVAAIHEVSICLKVDDRIGLSVPFYCLEKIKSAKTETVKLNETHSAIVTEDIVMVGCQEFKPKAIKKLYKTLKKLQKK